MKLLPMIVAAILAVTAIGAVAADHPATRPASSGAATTSPAPALLPRPSTAIPLVGCVTPQCHPGIKAHKVIHGPIANNACDNCHLLTDAKSHTFEFTRQKAELCTYCHEFSTAQKPVVHKPVSLGECTACHDPHGGELPSLLRDKTVAETCARCHDDVSHGAKFLHTPVAQGACDTCHPPHAARFPNLLDAVGADLCLTCHRDFDARLSQARFRHKAIEQGCIKCHDPHGSAQPMALRQAITPLCLSCHPKIKQEIAQALDKHSVVTSDRGCLTCHTPHGGNLSDLMADIPTKTCMGCHKNQIKTHDRRIIPAMPGIIDPKTYKHGPIREGQCAGCHDVHGGPRGLLLDRAYSTGLYFDPGSEEYSLCLKCHDARLIRDPNAPTGFRNGKQNLHLVHVRTGRRGHNCRDCHATHAASNDRIVRDTLSFGVWQMPIDFKRTTTGGSCDPGCHVAYSYDRVHPVAYPPPASQPATTVARTIIDDLPFGRWSGKDLSGAPVAIPDPNRPTVILVLGPEVTQDRQALAQVKLALGPSPTAQVLLLVAGPEAQAQAQSLAEDKATTWPVIADPSGVLCGRLSVRGWPTTVVLRSNGAKVAAIAGAPATLAIRLMPYVDLAAGKINRAALDQSPPAPGLVTDGPGHQADWSLQMAQRLLDEGETERARTLLTDAIRVHGPTAPLQAAMARTLIQLGQASQALNLLNQPLLSTWDLAQRDALRGQALVSLQVWDQALKALSDAVARDPALAEAHYWLGEVYEHDAQWQKAAGEYRAYHDLMRAK